MFTQHEPNRTFMEYRREVYLQARSCIYKYQEIVERKLAWLNIPPELFQPHVEMTPHEATALCKVRRCPI